MLHVQLARLLRRRRNCDLLIMYEVNGRASELSHSLDLADLVSP